jgi:molecular chaperone DnaK
VEVHVVQGEREMARDNKTLGRFILDGIPPAPRGVPQIEVSFDIDANGIVNVTAKDKATNREQHITIAGSSNLDKGAIDRMVKEAEAHAEEDRRLREEAETRNKGEQIVHQSRRQLTELSDKMTEDQKSDIESKINRLEELLKGTDTAAIQSASDEIQQAFFRITEEMYKQAAGSEGQGYGEGQEYSEGQGYGDGAGSPDGHGDVHGAPSGSEDVIDAEFRPS